MAKQQILWIFRFREDQIINGSYVTLKHHKMLFVVSESVGLFSAAKTRINDGNLPVLNFIFRSGRAPSVRKSNALTTELPNPYDFRFLLQISCQRISDYHGNFIYSIILILSGSKFNKQSIIRSQMFKQHS